MILEKENYKKMTNTSTDIISGLEQYADSEGPRIDLNSLYDDGDNEIVLLGVGNIDGGTMGMELLTYMRGMKKILLVDAINGGDAPGTIYEFPHKELEQYFTEHISVHEVGMQDILRIRAIQDDPLEDAVVIGVEPESLEIGFEPSEPVQCALPEVKKRILHVLREWGVTVEPKA